MGKPTPEEAKEMKCRKLIKDIWENEFCRDKDDLKVITLVEQFVKVKTIEDYVDIRFNLFEDYFAATNEDLKVVSLDKIKNHLKHLL